MVPCPRPPLLRLCTCGLFNMYVMKILHVNSYYLYNIEAKKRVY